MAALFPIAGIVALGFLTWIYFQPLLAVWLLILAGLTYFRPIWGIAVLFVVMSIETARPIFGSIFVTYPELEFAACFLAWIATQRSWQLNWRPLFWGVPFLVIVALSGLANIPFYKIPPHLLRISELFLMIFLVLNTARAEIDRKLLTLAVGAAALLYCGYGIYEFLGHPCDRIQSFLGNPNQFAGYLNWMLPFFLAFFFFNRPFRARALWFYLALLVFITLALTFSRGGLIAGTFTSACLALLGFYLHRKQLIQLPLRQSATIAISAVVVLAFTGAVLAVQPLGQQIFDCLRGTTEARWGPDVASPQFLGPRPSYYEAGFGLWKENLWLGVGPGNFEEAVEEYYPRKGLGDPDTFIRVHAHNLFLDLAIQYGTLGPVAFLFFIAAVFRSLFHHWSKSAYALAGIGLLIAFLVHNLFDVSFPSTALEMGFLLGLAVRETSRDQ